MQNHDRQFHALPPHPGLRDYILYYNVVFPSGNTFMAQYTLMPNACGTLSLAFDGRDVIAELWGASLAPVLLGTEPDRYRALLLVQLSPYGLYQITRQSQGEFAGKRLWLSDIDRELCGLLRQAFTAAETADGLARACDRILYRRMERQVVSDALLLAASVISNRHGQVPVAEAARQAGYSQRHLNRLFLTQIGTSVKYFARLTRFTHILKQIQTFPRNFAALSQQAGYFDQAHFDKDFKAISGVTPQVYLKTMSGFYYDAAEASRTISSKEE